MPSQTKTSLPNFTSSQIDKIYFKQQFGLLSPLPTTQLGNDELMSSWIIKVVCPPCLTDHSLMKSESSQILKLIFLKKNRIRMVCCLSDKEIWTCGHNNNLIRLYDLEGELQTDRYSNKLRTYVKIYSNVKEQWKGISGLYRLFWQNRQYCEKCSSSWNYHTRILESYRCLWYYVRGFPGHHD